MCCPCQKKKQNVILPLLIYRLILKDLLYGPCTPVLFMSLGGIWATRLTALIHMFAEDRTTLLEILVEQPFPSSPFDGTFILMLLPTVIFPSRKGVIEINVMIRDIPMHPITGRFNTTYLVVPVYVYYLVSSWLVFLLFLYKVHRVNCPFVPCGIRAA